MKTYTFLFLFLNIFSFGQNSGDDEQLLSNTELNFQIFNNPNNFTVNFVVTPAYLLDDDYMYVSTTYYSNDGCYFVQSFPNPRHAENVKKTISLYGNPNLCINNGLGYGIIPFGGVDCHGHPNGSIAEFQSGLYFISIQINNVESSNFYFDTRHSQFPGNICGYSGFIANDIGVRYDVGNNKLYWKFTPSASQSLNGFRPFLKGETLNWWELETVADPSPKFYGYYDRHFSFLQNIQRLNMSPFLTWWAPNVTSTINNYLVQRSINGNPFITISTINHVQNVTAYSFHDTQIYWPPNLTSALVQYRIVTVYADSNWPKEFSNTQKIFTDLSIQKEKISDSNYNFEVKPNYPNPFNPTTRISYHIPEDTYVTLKIFSILGQEIIFISDFQAAGEYDYEFNGSSLPSGVYFYFITAGKYTKTNKMVLTK